MSVLPDKVVINAVRRNAESNEIVNHRLGLGGTKVVEREGTNDGIMVAIVVSSAIVRMRCVEADAVDAATDRQSSLGIGRTEKLLKTILRNVAGGIVLIGVQNGVEEHDEDKRRIVAAVHAVAEAIHRHREHGRCRSESNRDVNASTHHIADRIGKEGIGKLIVTPHHDERFVGIVRRRHDG